MSLYGINAYTSSMMYGSLFGKNSQQSSSGSGSNLDFLKSFAKTDSNTSLQSLMEKANVTRTRGWQKAMVAEYRKVFAGESNGTNVKANELGLSQSAKSLAESAKSLATSSSPFFGEDAGMQKKIAEFIENYNSTIDGLKNSESVTALRKGASMVSTTAAYSRSLSNVGITIGEDNKLSFDSEKFAGASQSSLNSLFKGSYSYASKIGDRASEIDRNAQIQANTIYNNLGQRLSLNNFSFSNNVSGSLFNQLF